MKNTPSAASPFPLWLTSARGLFATWIILRHMSLNNAGPAAWIVEFLPNFKGFDIPTTFFFILSGFIFAIGRPAPLTFAACKSFWIARLAGLYPLYFLMVLVSAPIGWKLSGGDWPAFLRQGLLEMTFLQGWFGDIGLSWLTVGWFMSSIAFSYMSFPLVAPLLRPRSDGFLLALVVGLGALACALGMHVDAHAGDSMTAAVVRRTPAFPLLLFVQGIALGLLYSRGLRKALVLVGALLAGVGVHVLLRETPHGRHYLIGGMLWVLPMMLLSLAKSPPPSAAVAYGELGFTLYMLHWPLYIYSRGVLKALGLSEWLTSPVYLVVILAVIIAASYLVYHRLERPLQDSFKLAFSRS